MVDTLTTLWRTVEELLTAYPSGIFSRDRKGRTPLQLGMQTVKKNYNTTTASHSYFNGSYRPSMAIQRKQQEQQQQHRQQEMMLSALSVLERYETIYSTAMGDRNPTAVTRVQHPSSSLSSPLSSPQYVSNTTVPPPLMDEGVVKLTERETSSQHSSAILSIRQQHLETLKTLQTMFQKQRDEDVAQYERQQVAIQQQLDESLNRERQIQNELENVRRQLQGIQQCSNGNHSCLSTELSRENTEQK